jgi:hypothetical protein
MKLDSVSMNVSERNRESAMMFYTTVLSCRLFHPKRVRPAPSLCPNVTRNVAFSKTLDWAGRLKGAGMDIKYERHLSCSHLLREKITQ